MASWQEQADRSKQIDSAKTTEAKAVHNSEMFDVLNLFQQIGIEQILRDVNNETKFWGGEGKITYTPPKLTSDRTVTAGGALEGYCPSVEEEYEYFTKKAFGSYIKEFTVGSGGDQSGYAFTETVKQPAFGLHDRRFTKLKGYKTILVPVRPLTISLLHEHEDSGRSGYYSTTTVTVNNAGPREVGCSESDIRRLLTDAIVADIQSRDNDLTLPQLIQQAKIRNAEKIRSIKSKIGEVKER